LGSGPWEAASGAAPTAAGGMPSDAALGKAVKVMLKGADMASVSMKKIRADLEAGALYTRSHFRST
jgi:hypothetical protein